jgi:hypothetical protein
MKHAILFLQRTASKLNQKRRGKIPPEAHTRGKTYSRAPDVAGHLMANTMARTANVGSVPRTPPTRKPCGWSALPSRKESSAASPCSLCAAFPADSGARQELSGLQSMRSPIVLSHCLVTYLQFHTYNTKCDDSLYMFSSFRGSLRPRNLFDVGGDDCSGASLFLLRFRFHRRDSSSLRSSE